jgi:hypothetical protein
MNSGNSVRDANPRAASAGPGKDDADRPVSDDQSPRPGPPFQGVQDIQEIIDKLAAVTKQLRRPRPSDS